jgi:sec-independent protein translocase protein TatA
MLQNLTGWHALILLAIVLLIFGAAKLPALARSVGQSMRILKQESGGRADEAAADATEPATAAAPLTTVHPVVDRAS